MKTERSRKWHAIFEVNHDPTTVDLDTGEKKITGLTQASKWRTDKNQMLRVVRELRRNKPEGKFILRTQEFMEKHIHPIDRELLAESRRLVRLHRVADPEKALKCMEDPVYAKALAAAAAILDEAGESAFEPHDKTDKETLKAIEGESTAGSSGIAWTATGPVQMEPAERSAGMVKMPLQCTPRASARLMDNEEYQRAVEAAKNHEPA